MKNFSDSIHEARLREIRLTQKGLAIRRHKMHDPVSQLLAEIDPNGYASVLADLRAEWLPASPYEESLVERLADTHWRIRGCWAMDSKILMDGMQEAPGGEHAPNAMAQAYLKDISGPNRLNKLGVYQEKLENEFHRCLGELRRLGAYPRRAAGMDLSKLQKLEPWTSVIQ